MRLVFRSCVAALAAVFAVLTLPSSPTRAAGGPGDAVPASKPFSPRPYTYHNFRRDLLAHNRETMSGAYQKAGKHGPWDAAAVAFLDGMAEYFSNGTIATALYDPKDAPRAPEMAKQGEKLVAAGCDDPLVLYCYGAMLHDSGNADAALGVMRRCLLPLYKSKYPSARKMAMAERHKRLDGSRENCELVVPIILEHRALVPLGKLSDVARRVVAKQVWGSMETDPRPQQVAYMDALRKHPDADPWVRDVLDGRLHIKLAWESRGGGWAQTVTDDGWAGFHKHLAEARDCLKRAWALAPNLPEPAVDMITVAMGAGDQLGEEEMTWFTRAESAQLDEKQAYASMYNALLPRWGGSHAEMYELGLRAMKTERYDTEVPWQLVRAVRAIAADTGQGWGVALAQAGVYDALCHVAEQYAAAQAQHGRDAWYLTYRAALACRAEKFAEARRLLDKLGDRVDPTAFAALDATDPAGVIAMTYAMAGPTADAAKRAEAAVAREDFQAALVALRELAADPQLSPKAKPYVDGRTAQADRRVRYARGEWVDIQPKGSLVGWNFKSGTWSLDAAGQLLGTTGGPYTPAILCEESFGERVELAGVLEPRGPAGGRPGVVFGRELHPVLYLSVTRGSVGLFTGGGGYKHIAKHPSLDAIDGPLDFLATLDGDTVSLSIAGTPVLEKHPVPPDILHDVRVGVQVSTGGAARFSKLRVRKLPGGDAAAAPAEAPQVEPAPPAGEVGDGL